MRAVSVSSETFTVPRLNATTVCTPPTMSATGNANKTRTRVSESLVRSVNCSSTLGSPQAVQGAVATATAGNIAPPVLSQPAYRDTLDFLSQADLDYRWLSLQEELKNTTLSEEAVRQILVSGVLQTATGKVLADLIAAAILRSIKPMAALTNSRLKEVIDTVCHLPREQWQSALGENVQLPSGREKPEGVTGFIQSQLDRSSATRDERIANNELLSDVDWQALKDISKQGRQYIRKGDGEPDLALMQLEDAKELRPSPKEAHAQLEAFALHLDERDVTQVRWPQRYVEQVRALRDQIKPDGGIEQRTRSRLDGPGWLETLFGMWDTSPVPMPDTAPSGAHPWPLSVMVAFDRSADFHSNVSIGGPSVPASWAGKFLYACNALDTFGALRLDTSHITTRPITRPAGDAWKNGASGFSGLPLEPVQEISQTAASNDPFTQLEQFATQLDGILHEIVSKVLPWDSTYANELEEAHEMLESVKVYRETTAPYSSGYAADQTVVLEQLSGWLERTTYKLLASGAAVLGPVGNLIERNAGKTAGIFAAYMVISNFCANWFFPEPEPMVDAMEGRYPTPTITPDRNVTAQEYAIEEMADLLDDQPDFASQLDKVISASAYPDPTDDPQLIEDIGAFLPLPVAGLQDVTYLDLLNEIVGLAQSDADEEFETDPLGGSATEFDVTTSADNLKNVRNKRSLIKGEGEGEGVSTDINTLKVEIDSRESIKLLIRASQRVRDAKNQIPSSEEIVPGITFTQAADLFIEDYIEQQLLLNPSLFIVSSVEDFIKNCSLPDDLKKNLSYQRVFQVRYDLPRPTGKDLGYYAKNKYRYKDFSFAEVMLGQHQKEAKSRENVNVEWPAGYTSEFQKAVELEGAKLWDNYKGRADKYFSQSKAYDLWKYNFQNNLNQVVGKYLEREKISIVGKETADKFLNGEIRIRPVIITHGRYSDRFPVANAVFLSTKWKGPEGLFVFLGKQHKVIESPVALFSEGGKSIEEYPELREALSAGITLKGLLSRDDDDFKYSQGRFKLHWNPRDMFDDYKWSYEPILFGRQDGPNRYGESHDSFKDLFDTAVSQSRSDMDTLVSTWGERVTDKLMEILQDTLTMFAAISALPGAPTAGIALLMGAGASAAQYARGVLHDDPLESERHKANAVSGMIGQVAGKYIGKLLGSSVSKAADSRLALKIGERLKAGKILPGRIAKHFNKYGNSASPFLENANKIEKWIAPKVRALWSIQDKVDRKFTNNLLVKRLQSLGKGPHVAQKMMDRSRVLYFRGDEKGFVYRGFAVRGDMRPPHEVFSSGFNSGGQASGYYNSNGMGAFHSGGGKGGYTYLIDGRRMDGRDVLRNKNWKTKPDVQLSSNPYQISYGAAIPGKRIIGAYDGAGKFIPNPQALSRAIEKSIPTPFVQSVPFPLKPFVQNKNSTMAEVRLQP